MPTASQTDDVIIIGAGPVGLCLALQLADHGLSVRVFEKESAIEEDLRASTFHPPTLDMLAPSGITDELVADGLPCPTWQIRLHPSGDRAVFDLSVLSDVTAYPYRLQCEQWKLARALHRRVAKCPDIEVQFGCEAEKIVQDDNGVSVTILKDGESTTYRAHYLAGCDGSRSIVRKSMGLEFAGLTYPETTLLATTLFPFEDHLEGLSNVSYCWRDNGGNFSLLKVPGRWRVSIYPEEGLSIEEQITPQALNASLQEIIPRAEPYDIMERRPYRVHMRIVPNYREGRVLLAGDAAHVNSPSGGMGLNGGLHDAFELSRALIEVLCKGADPSRLDLYDRRRRPIARDEILAQADRNRARMRERDPAKRRELLAGLQAITGDRARMRDYLYKSSMLDGLQRAAAID